MCYHKILIKKFFLLSFLVLCCAFPLYADSPYKELQLFLRKHINFSDADLVAMQKGEVVSKILKTSNHSEVAAFGVVRINVSGELFVDRFRDIVKFKKSDSVVEIGKFSDPPQLEDLKGLSFDVEDLEDMKKCVTGDCDVKLPVGLMQRLQKDINWSAPDYKEKTNIVLRQGLLNYVKSYLATGNSALAEYHDKKKVIRLADEFRALLGQSPYLFEYVPEFYKYLDDFPKTKLPNTENFIYWSVEKFGLKPVISITHVTIYKRYLQGKTYVLIASKQIYASHYFDASLGLTALADEVDDTSKPISYLMYLNRSRTDTLKGMFSGIKRSLIGGRVLEGMEKSLTLNKKNLERTTF